MQTVFIVNQPNAWVYLGGLWGKSELKSPASAKTRWMQQTRAALQSGEPAGPRGRLRPVHHQRRCGEPRAFTVGQPQVLESVSAGSENWATVLGAAVNANYDGYVGEVVVYSGTLNTVQQAAVNNYLNAKWLGIGAPSSNFLPSTTPVSLTGAGALLDLGYNNETIASLSGVAGSTVTQEGGVLTVGGDNSSTTFAGVLSLAGGLTKVGGGTLTLPNSANAIAGTTTISAGAVQIGDGATGPGALGGNLVNNSSAANPLVFNTPAGMSVTFSGNISGTGTGAVTKSGPGTVLLSGGNTQAGGLAVNGGVLTLNAAQAYGGATIISAGTLNVLTAPASLPTISGLAYHLDASNSATLSISGGSVTAWNDVNGNGTSFTQSTLGLPTYLAGGINGLGVVNFGNYTNLASTATLTVQTVFIVNQPNSYVNLGGMWGNANPAADTGIREDLTADQWRTNTGGGDFANTNGATYINGVLSNPAPFTPGVPQLLEAVSSGPQSNWAGAWANTAAPPGATTTVISARSSSIAAR